MEWFICFQIKQKTSVHSISGAQASKPYAWSFLISISILSSHCTFGECINIKASVLSVSPLSKVLGYCKKSICGRSQSGFTTGSFILEKTLLCLLKCPTVLDVSVFVKTICPFHSFRLYWLINGEADNAPPQPIRLLLLQPIAALERDRALEFAGEA